MSTPGQVPARRATRRGHAGLAEPKIEAPAFGQGMNLSAPPAVITGPSTFSTQAPATRDAADFMPRILPYHVLALPPEVRRISWRR